MLVHPPGGVGLAADLIAALELSVIRGGDAFGRLASNFSDFAFDFSHLALQRNQCGSTSRQPSRTAGSGAVANASPFVNETDNVCVHVHGKAGGGG